MAGDAVGRVHVIRHVDSEAVFRPRHELDRDVAIGVAFDPDRRFKHSRNRPGDKTILGRPAPVEEHLRGLVVDWKSEVTALYQRIDIRRNEDLMAGSGTEAAEAGAKLPGLMVMEKRIESVREWPFDAPTLTRFFLYVAIPLGSWIGGALVERLLGAALD